MNVWIRRTLQVGILSAGLVIAGAVAAQADEGPELTSLDNVGIGNGDQVVFPVQLPTNICGNAAAAAGDATAYCEGGAVAKQHTAIDDITMWSEDNVGIGVGDQVVGTLQGPIDVSGNAIAATGEAVAGSEGGSKALLKRAPSDSRPEWTTDGNVGVGNGNQVSAPTQVPVDISGNAVAAAGDADAWTEGGSHAKYNHTATPDMTTIDNVGMGVGNQVPNPVQTPVDISGNAASAAGDAMATSEGGSTATLKRAPAEGSFVDSMHSDGNVGVGNGNQVVAPIQIPVNICGNAIVAGGGDAMAGCEGGALAKLKDNGPGVEMTSTDNVGVGNGNQVVAPIQVPINICGNALTVLGGESEASCEGGSTAKIKSSSIPVLSSTDNIGVGVGNQVWVPIQAPIEISGNAVSALGGDTTAASEGGATAIQK